MTDVTLTPQVDGEDWSDDNPAPVRDAQARDTLTAILAALGETLAVSGAVTTDVDLSNVESLLGGTLTTQLTRKSPQNVANSTLVALADGEEFLGTYTEVAAGGTLLVFAFSDQPIDLSLEYSPDGVSPSADPFFGVTDYSTFEDTSSPGFYVYYPPAITTPVDRFVRLRAGNSSGSDATIMQAYLWQYEPGDEPWGFVRADTQLGTIIDPQYLLTRSVIAGQQPDGDLVNARATGEAWSTTDLLAAGETVQSPWIDTDGYESIELWVSTDVPSADGGIEIERTADTQADPVVAAAQPIAGQFSAADVANGRRVIFLSPNLDGLRVTYTNGDTDQTQFTMAVTLHTQPVEVTRVGLDSFVPAPLLAQLTRGALLAPNAAGQWDNVGRGGEGEALNTHITDVDVDVSIGATSKLVTGQVQVTSGAVTALPVPNFRVKSWRITNGSDSTRLTYGAKQGLTAFNGDWILPLDSVDVDYDMVGDGPVYLTAAEGEGDVTNDVALTPDTVDSSTGVTSASNLLTSDDSRVSFDNTGDSVTVSGFDDSLVTLPTVAEVVIELEGRKEAGAPGEQAAWVDTVEGEANNLTFVTSGVVTADPDAVYLLTVSRRDQNADVVQVTDTLGVAGWTLINEVSRSESRTTAYWATGATTDGTVTVTFDTAADYATLAITRLDNVLTSDPVEDSDTDSGSNASFGGTVSATENGITVYAIGSEIDAPSPGAGYTERADFGSASSNDNRQAVNTSPNASTGSKTWGGTLAGSANHSAIAVSFRPALARDPQVTVSYTVDGEAGETTGVLTFSAGTDAVQTVDVSGDREWTAADLGLLAVTTEATDVGAAAFDGDSVALAVVESQSVVRASYAIAGES